jgi:putative spermidine/putrescine transport system permease protein
VVDQPVEWLLFSDFSVVLAFVHLYTMFMIVPIFNSMMRIDRSLLEAARDAGASGWQTLWNVSCRCRKHRHPHRLDLRHHHRDGRLRHHRRHGRPADRLGRQDHPGADVATCSSRLAAANAVILLAVVLMIIWGLTRLVDLRKEL